MAAIKQYYSRRTPLGEMLKEARDEAELTQIDVADRLAEDYGKSIGVQVIRDLEYLGPRNEDHLQLIKLIDQVYGSNVAEEIEKYGLGYRLPCGDDFVNAIEYSGLSGNKLSQEIASQLNYSVSSMPTYIRIWRVVGLPNIRVAEEIDDILGTDFADNFEESERKSARILERARAKRKSDDSGSKTSQDPEVVEVNTDEERVEFDADELFADMEFDLEMLVRSWRVEGFEPHIELVAEEIGVLVNMKDELLDKLIEVIGMREEMIGLRDEIRAKLEERISN